MIELKQETYSKAEVEKLLKDAEEDKLAWIKIKHDENEKLRKELNDRHEWYNSYIASVSENGFKRYQKLEEKTNEEIKELKNQLTGSHPDLINKDLVSWWSKQYPEVYEEVKLRKITRGGGDILPTDFVEHLIEQGKKLVEIINELNPDYGKK